MQTRRELLKSAAALASSPYLLNSAFAQQPAASSEVFADFESGTFDGWTLTGSCWTKEPHSATTVPGITGFQGKRFLCTLHPTLGNNAAGKAVSRTFTVEKPYIHFLIGGGNYPGQACLNFVVDGKVARTATGDNTAEMRPETWDVAELLGKTARFEVVDVTAGMDRGYVMVDTIQLKTSMRPSIPEDLSTLPYQARVTRMAESWRERFSLPGVWCAVIKDGKVAAFTISGVKSVVTGNAAGPTDYLNICSISKPVTGMILAQFVARGVIGYDARVSSLFPELAAKHESSPLLRATLGQAMAHTAGLPRETGKLNPDVFASGLELRYALLSPALQDPNLVQPGTKFAYSNFGPSLAVSMVERAVERVTGKQTTYEDWISGHEGQAVGLSTPKSFDWRRAQRDGEVFPHYVLPDGSVRSHTQPNSGAIASSVTKYGPAGSVSITLEDFAAFAVYTMHNHTALPKEVYRRAVSRVDPSLQSDTAASWHLATPGLLFHDGFTGRGEWAVSRVDVAKQVGFVFYTNAVWAKEAKLEKDNWKNIVQQELHELLY